MGRVKTKRRCARTSQYRDRRDCLHTVYFFNSLNRHKHQRQLKSLAPPGEKCGLAADRVASVLMNEALVEVFFAPPRLRKYVKALSGSTVTAIDTRGKAMLTRFDTGLTLYSHNQLYGIWRTAARDRLPKTTRSLRVALHTASNCALLYSATDIEVLTDSELAEHRFLTRLGPDILDQRVSAADVARRLLDGRFRNRSLGALYLDQSFMAGVGNYLRSEILYTAGAHYMGRPSTVDKNTLGRLARATLSVSRRSYRTRGLTVTQQLAKTLRRRGLPFQQHRFWVYRREGLPCYRCSSTIVRASVASRGLFFCPACQASSQG